MHIRKFLVAAIACSALTLPSAGGAQGFPKLPRIPKVPSIPKVEMPGSVSDASSVPNVSAPTSSKSSADLTNEFMEDSMVIAQGMNIGGNSQSEDDRIDAEIANYRAAVDRLASSRYNSVPAQMRNSLQMQMKQYFDQRTTRVDADINWINGKVAENSGYDERIGTRVFNSLLALDAEMDAANTLFPGTPGYQEAGAKVDAMMTKFGSRGDAANSALDTIGAENAAKVQMPPATVRDASVEAMFRRAWATGGIPYEVKKINIRSGWSDRRE